jgi:hypothetical protein
MFLKLMGLAEAGRVRWIVVSERDRFGTEDADEFVHFRYLLRKWGCRLYDTTGTDWTRKDFATVITAVMDGEKSEQEQHSLSRRVLGGKAAKAAAGEWQGGPVRLGFDVVCYDRRTGQELWRVVCGPGRHQRSKLYPDGREERYDGRGNFPAHVKATEGLRLARSIDTGRVDAAVETFKRYATESVSPTTLAHWLNSLGWRNGGGGCFQHNHVEEMLCDPAYAGQYAWNRIHVGKFHRLAGGQPVLEINRAEKMTRNDRADWVRGELLDEPLVDRETWDAVQRKLGQQSTRTNAPRSPAQYLAGLVFCGNCGARMVTGSLRKTTKHPRKDGHVGERYEYFCGTYFKCCREKRRSESCCLRNGVFQDTLEEYVNRYLEEMGKRLELLTRAPETGGHLTARLEGQEDDAWQAFCDGLDRVATYLARHHPDEYSALLQEETARREQREALLRDYPEGYQPPEPGTLARVARRAYELEQAGERPDQPRLPANDFVRDFVAYYRSVFDPSGLAVEVARLEAEHTAMMKAWADLPTLRAKEKAQAELGALEARIEELERQQQNVADVVERQWQEVCDLEKAVRDARRAMTAEAGEHALRRAEALRSGASNAPSPRRARPGAAGGSETPSWCR